MTRRKPLPTGYCPHCGIQYVALDEQDLMCLALLHCEGEHAEVLA